MPKAAYAVVVVLLLVACGASIACLILARQGQAELAARLKQAEGKLEEVRKETIDARRLAEQAESLSRQRENALVPLQRRILVDVGELRTGAGKDDKHSLKALADQLDELKKLVAAKGK